MKYFLWVLGCAMNYSDAERIKTILNLLGYQKTEKEEEADLIITVACSVRQTAIDRIYGKVKSWRKLKKDNPKLITILTGCVLKKDLNKMADIFDVIFEIEELGKLPGLLGEKLTPEKTEVLGKSGEYLGIIPSYESKFRAYVPIMTGCNNFCSYCAVPHTRGREKSRPKEEILKESQNLIKKGFKEITFLGQNVNSYGQDFEKEAKGSQFFIELLKELDEIEGEWRGYFYSNHPKDMSDDLIALIPILKHFPAYIHLPLQSGSNRIIKEMNRHYTKDQYLALVGKIRGAMPEVTLTTDIMVGYPGEEEKDFRETADVMEKAKFDMAFTAQYSPRPGTKSAKDPDSVPKAEKKKREKILIDILAGTAKENNQRLVGKKLRVLIDGKKSDKYYGRTEGYKVVEIETDQPMKVGQFCDVEIESAGAWKLTGLI